MWFAPRVTVRRLIETEERPSWVPVVALAGINQGFVWLQNHSQFAFRGGVETAAGFALFFGAVTLVYSVLVGPFLLAFVGGWLGGDGDPVDIRQAVAWSLVPQAVAAPLWIPLLAAYGRNAFNPQGLPLMALALVFLIAIAAFWTLPLQVAGLAEALRFSIWRALLSIFILSLPLFVFGAL
jgi:Yip1-like protein